MQAQKTCCEFLYLVSLPSRNEPVSFTCRPVTGTIGDLLEQIKEEDRGVDHAAIYAQVNLVMLFSDHF